MYTWALSLFFLLLTIYHKQNENFLFQLLSLKPKQLVWICHLKNAKEFMNDDESQWAIPPYLSRYQYHGREHFDYFFVSNSSSEVFNQSNNMWNLLAIKIQLFPTNCFILWATSFVRRDRMSVINRIVILVWWNVFMIFTHFPCLLWKKLIVEYLLTVKQSGGRYEIAFSQKF